MSARTVTVTWTLQVDDSVTDDQLAHVIGNAGVQFDEPVLSPDHDGEPTWEVIVPTALTVIEARTLTDWTLT